MDPNKLKAQLESCLCERIPVGMVVAAAGNAFDGAVDPIRDILALRNEYRDKGLDFNLLVDATWGGYMMSTIRRDFRLIDDLLQTEAHSGYPALGEVAPFIEDVSGIPMSNYVINQLGSIRDCDSVTLDPHKLGYVHCPVGAVCYRNGLISTLTTHASTHPSDSSDVILDEVTRQTTNLEDPMSAAASAAVYLSHRVIRPTVSGYGKIMTESLLNTKLFYLNLLWLNIGNHDYELVPLIPLSAPSGKRPPPSFQELRQIIENLKEKNFLADPEIRDYFRELGPDLNIVEYAFNPKLASGEVSSKWTTYQEFNWKVCHKFHARLEASKPDKDDTRFVLSMVSFRRDQHGEGFIDQLADRIGLDRSDAPDHKIPYLGCLRSVIINPYMPYAGGSEFISSIVSEIDRAVREVCATWRNKIP